MKIGRVGAIGFMCGFAIVATAVRVQSADLLRAAAVGNVTDAPSGGGKAERFAFEAGLAEALVAAPLDAPMRIADWPVAPGQRRAVVLTHRDVYAQDAKIVAIDGGKEIEIPRSSLVFLWGSAEGDGSVGVVVWVDPRSLALGGATATPDGSYDLRPSDTGPRSYDLAASHDPGEFACGSEALAQDTLRQPLLESRDNAIAAPLVSSLHSAVIAVDTDNEFMSIKFTNNTTNATNYIAQVFAGLAAIYERDLFVRPLQGFTILRPSTTPDPYSSPGASVATSAELDEVSNYWLANYGSIGRALVVMLSGKQTGGGWSGIAFVPGLCDSRYGVSFNQTLITGTTAGASDFQLVGHEMGHNFGAHHTHCTDTNAAVAGIQPIDFCFSTECSWAPPAPASCPAAFTVSPVNGTPVAGVRGTLMSYCHLLAGCGVTNVFHPQSISLGISTTVDSAVGRCLFPAGQLGGIMPNAGTTAGGTVVTISGAGFGTPATVTIGGTAATGVSVLNTTTLTATTAAHAAGIVDVAVDVPSGPATLLGGYQYFTPPPPGNFYTLSPCRLVDTRATAAGGLGSPALVASARRNFTLAGVCGIPAGAKALSLNVTVTGPTQPGFVTLFPGDGLAPGTSTINFSAGQTRANNSVVLMATSGAGTLAVLNGSAGTVNLIVDVNGYFQ